MKSIPYFNQAFAGVLKKHRARSKLTQDQVASIIDSNISAIRRFEYAKQTPSSTTLILIARAFDIEPSDFLKEIIDQIEYLTNKDSTAK